MSYNPNVLRDDQQFFYKNGKPYSWYKQDPVRFAFDTVVTRGLGSYKPFWAKGLDYAIPKFKWIYKNRRWLKYYIPLGYPYYNAKNEIQTPTQDNKEKFSNARSKYYRYESSRKYRSYHNCYYSKSKRRWVCNHKHSSRS